MSAVRGDDRTVRWLADLMRTLDRAVELVDRGEAQFRDDVAMPLAFEALCHRVGDLAKRLVSVDPDRYAASVWRQAARNRDFVVHHDDRVDLDVLWRTVSLGFPELRQQIAIEDPPTMSEAADSVSVMDRIQVIDSESARLAEVLAQADPTARVPTCPDWDAAALLWHLTGVQRFWADVLAQNPQTDEEVGALEQEDAEPPGPIADMLPLREAATADLLAQLRALPDEDPRWSWWDADQTVGFTRRMQTYEATMHRVDAELAAGLSVSSIAAEVAAGALDHCVDVMWGWMPDWADYQQLAVVELTATDADARWLVEIGRWFGTGPESGNAFDMARASRAVDGAAAATVSGTVEQLSRWAWSRRPDEGAITIEGNEDAVAAIARLIEQGIQ